MYIYIYIEIYSIKLHQYLSVCFYEIYPCEMILPYPTSLSGSFNVALIRHLVGHLMYFNVIFLLGV